MVNLHFDTALPELMRIVSSHPSFQERMEDVCVIRDLKGCLRLVIKPSGNANRADLEISLLEETLKALRTWFQGPILTTCADEPVARKHTADILLEKARKQKIAWPPHWPQEVRGELGQTVRIDLSRWCSLQRVQSKETWLARTSGEPPWDLVEREPAIVSFYSFKGGVGRTTCMGIVAYQLARAGYQVVCVDLDLEAPGVADVFGMEMPELGLMDYLLSSLVGGGKATLKPSDVCKKVQLHEASLWVVPAGKMDVHYVEKLARLDYLSGTDLANETQSPVAVGMRNLLDALRGQCKPDYIFLDCRAGFHDLGGLGLHDLAHVEVIVGRASLQTFHGLDVILPLQKQRREKQQRRLCMVQTFVSAKTEERLGQHERWRKKLYDLFEKHDLYAELESGLSEEDDQGVHYPWSIAHNQSIENASSLAQDDEDLKVLIGNSSGEYGKLLERIKGLCEPETQATK